MHVIERGAATVEAYVKGMVRGDRALLKGAFHPDASSVGHCDGALA
ncbi:nuclear transport factor 2 family protein [Defluviimonas sp. WL0002]|nr:nuclear transport factor 2 family protein [Defluviimonas sp. WL0002]